MGRWGSSLVGEGDDGRKLEMDKKFWGTGSTSDYSYQKQSWWSDRKKFISKLAFISLERLTFPFLARTGIFGVKILT